MTYLEACQALETLYATLPTVSCQGLCTDACGPLGMSALEYRQLHRKSPLKLVEDKEPTCPLLKRGRCTVYTARPLICRLWGVLASMACPWGCVPTRWLTVAEGEALMRQVAALSAQVFPGRQAHTLHTPALVQQVQERGAKALAWAVLAWGETTL